MNILKKIILASAAILACAFSANAAEAKAPEKVVVAYVTSWTDEIPDPSHMTHINYAFGHVNDSFNGVRVDNPDRLRSIVALKKQNPALKVLVSVGGWGSGRFSEMAADPKNRKAFANSCKKLVKDFNLDGIDIDWEYPTSSAAGISSSPADTDTYSALMHDLRKALGKNKILSLATIASGEYIDFPAFIDVVDLVNTMTYDMGNPPYLHNGLFPSENTRWMSSDQGVKAHLAKGVPAEKLVMGVPFYGRGHRQAMRDHRGIHRWDSKAMTPYVALADSLAFGYENVRSMSHKCRYINENNLRGAMYWDYASDGITHKLANTVKNMILDGRDFNSGTRRVVILSENAGQHKPFSDAAIKWLIDESALWNMQIQIFTNANYLADKNLIDSTDLIIQLDFPPYTWNEQAKANFIEYINEGHGAWIGFHHATLLGDFDGWPMWNWFSDFMGGITFKNYIAPLADGTVNVEAPAHPVMDGVAPSFVLADDEWYTYDRSPRPNVDVIASVDESTYSPASDVKMGDHPVVWSNPDVKAKNVYFQMGHSPRLFDSPDFCRMFRNALEWALY